MTEGWWGWGRRFAGTLEDCLCSHPSGQVPMVEVKAYRQMALLSSAFAFRWSKWNMTCSSTRVVFRVQYANQETTLSSKEKAPEK